MTVSTKVGSKILECPPDALGLVFEYLPSIQAWRARETSLLFQFVFERLQNERTDRKEPVPKFYRCKERRELATTRDQIATVTAQMAQLPQITRFFIFAINFIRQSPWNKELEELRNAEFALINSIRARDFRKVQRYEALEEAFFADDQKVYNLFGGKGALKNFPQLTEEQSALNLDELIEKISTAPIINHVMVNVINNRFLIVSNSCFNRDWYHESCFNRDWYHENGIMIYTDLTVFTLIFKKDDVWRVVISERNSLRRFTLFDEKFIELNRFFEKYDIKNNSNMLITNNDYINKMKRGAESKRKEALKASFHAQLDSLFGYSFEKFLLALPKFPLDMVNIIIKNDFTFSHLHAVPYMMNIKEFPYLNFLICNENGERQLFIVRCLKNLDWSSFGDPIIPQGEKYKNEDEWMMGGYAFAIEGKFANPESFAALQAWITAHKPQIENREEMPNPYFKGGE